MSMCPIGLYNFDPVTDTELLKIICCMNKCCMMLYNSQLSPSEMQFGLKEKHSTSICTLMYSEIINHYTNNKSNVYSCLLDASKAFDLVYF